MENPTGRRGGRSVQPADDAAPLVDISRKLKVDSRPHPTLRPLAGRVGWGHRFGSTQPLEAVPRKANDDFVHGVGEIVHDAVDEPPFQLAGVSVAQLHAHEPEYAFAKDRLAR